MDWWSKFYASTGEKNKCGTYLESGCDSLKVKQCARLIYVFISSHVKDVKPEGLPIQNETVQSSVPPTPPLFSCPALHCLPFSNNPSESSVLNLLLRHHSGRIWRKGHSPRLAGSTQGITSATINICLSTCSLRLLRLSRHPKSLSAIAHARFNPYPDSLGPTGDFSLRRDSENTSIFCLVPKQMTNDVWIWPLFMIFLYRTSNLSLKHHFWQFTVLHFEFFLWSCCFFPFETLPEN